MLPPMRRGVSRAWGIIQACWRMGLQSSEGSWDAMGSGYSSGESERAGQGDLEIDRVGWSLGFSSAYCPRGPSAIWTEHFNLRSSTKRGAFKQRRNVATSNQDDYFAVTAFSKHGSSSGSGGSSSGSSSGRLTTITLNSSFGASPP